jgi:ribose transport system substrate-binding protein
MNLSKLLLTFLIFCFLYVNANELVQDKTNKKKIVYIVSDISIPFWNIMAKGIEKRASLLDYDFEILDAQNSAKKELENTVKAIKEKVTGIIVSPTNSSACVTILKLANEANIPVVISDVGTDGGEYVSYISSNNKNGAYKIGKLLTSKMIEEGFSNKKVGIIAIPQKRLNGQERTIGFIKALDESNIVNADLKQFESMTNEKTYKYTKEMIDKFPNLHAIWLQTSHIYKGALKAINESEKKDKILLVTFDAEPEFLNLIPKGVIIASGMQQPHLMGETALVQLDSHLNGISVKKDLQLPILIISAKNIEKKLPIIKLNVLGIEK